ncbi:MAG: hypothetical protein EPN48_11175 [Microbacteriaceae bacterium]|nr:MAG: hypothetical protein EPN48_11175 [Microbacteriaceae bacterium]
MCPLSQLVLGDGEVGLPLPGDAGSFHCCGVGLQPAHLGLTSGSLRAAGSNGCGGEVCSRLSHHGFDLSLNGTGVGNGAQLRYEPMWTWR